MNTIHIFLLTLLASISTLPGFFIIFLKGNKNKIISKSLSFASGVMFSISFFELFTESIKFLNLDYNKLISVIIFIISFFIGFISSFILNKITSVDNKLYKTGLVSMIGIIMHNIPEGILTFATYSYDKTLGKMIILLIMMHNIPEGLSIAVPIYYSTKSKIKAFAFTLLSAISEPFGALIALLLLKDLITNTFLGITLSIVSGIMISISIFSLLPEAYEYDEDDKLVIWFMIGMIFVLINLII